MLRLDLPGVQLVFDDGRVTDAVAEDDSYTHTMIEMFMVEANEAVAGLLDGLGRAFLRRIHPPPDELSGRQLAAFLRACGHKIPRNLTRFDLQKLLGTVRGRPESHAVNLAVLKTFQQGEYSPTRIGHYALASEQYCHFTSPIRRYPDLTVHRIIAEHCRGRLQTRPPEDIPALVGLGQLCSAAERRAEAAEEELREVLLLQLLAAKVGERFDGIITGVAGFGIFVQLPRYLIDGLVRLADLGDDWWEVSARYGLVRGQRSGRKYRIGDRLWVQIVGVDIPRRQLNLVPAPEQPRTGKRKPKRKRKGIPKGKSRS